MPNMKQLIIIILFLLLGITPSFSQLGFSHEVGVVAGPLQFRSDFGVRSNERTNFGNTGFGVGIVHYINFAYRADCNCYTTDNYFNDHFKLRNEISWNRTELTHFGEFVTPDNTSLEADQLRAQRGRAQNFDIGSQLEWFPLSIRSFQNFAYRVAPYISLGVHYTLFDPRNSTTDVNNDGLVDVNDYFNPWVQAQIDNGDPTGLGFLRDNAGGTFSVVSSAGIRYKIGPLSDLVFDLRWQIYFRDDIDGVDHLLDSNRFNDWLVWFNFGYIYYLN